MCFNDFYAFLKASYGHFFTSILAYLFVKQ